MEIRPVYPSDDRNAISLIYEESWKYAYKGIVPQAYLYSIPAGQWAPKLDQEGVGSFVAVEDGKTFYERCGFIATEHNMEREIGGKMLREIPYRYSAGGFNADVERRGVLEREPEP